MTDLDSKAFEIVCAVMPQIMEGMTFGMMVADPQGKLLYHNPVADRFLGINSAAQLRDIPNLQLQKEIVRAAISAGHDDAVSRPAESCISWDRVVTVNNETRILALRTRMVRQRDKKYRVFFQESRRAQQAFSRVVARSALRCRPDNRPQPSRSPAHRHALVGAQTAHSSPE
ncbi:hypothetical protein AB4090_00285 [Acidithiobacillus sp. IBUN Pt1247-S3]|uniref:hypothetical protein n=1 Tax=Acidithiobacillus sp. IBUN Pt1247-S3 TaxID=3166642 RepID=UPI0034E5392F